MIREAGGCARRVAHENIHSERPSARHEAPADLPRPDDAERHPFQAPAVTHPGFQQR